MILNETLAGLLGTPETSLSGLSTLNVLSVFRLMLSSEPAGIIIGKNLEKGASMYYLNVAFEMHEIIRYVRAQNEQYRVFQRNRYTRYISHIKPIIIDIVHQWPGKKSLWCWIGYL